MRTTIGEEEEVCLFHLETQAYVELKKLLGQTHVPKSFHPAKPLEWFEYDGLQ